MLLDKWAEEYHQWAYDDAVKLQTQRAYERGSYDIELPHCARDVRTGLVGGIYFEYSCFLDYLAGSNLSLITTHWEYHIFKATIAGGDPYGIKE